MKLRDILIPLSLALLVTWGVRYFFSNDAADQAIQSGQSFKAPVQTDISSKPLLTHVDFMTESLETAIATVIETPAVIAEFSNHGGSLDRLTVKRQAGSEEVTITPLALSPAQSREQKMFFVALDTQTPYLYNLLSHTRDNSEYGAVHELVYRAETDQAIITKKYKLYDYTYQIDVALTVEPKMVNAPVQVRLFVPAPYMSELDSYERVHALIYNNRQQLEKISPADAPGRFWFSPSLLGVESRYFINALYGDAQQFAQRVYYKETSGTITSPSLVTIIESASVKEATTWHMNFYCGPKEAHQLSAVDARLLDTLDFGWLAPIARLLLWLLKILFLILHNYGWAIIVLTLLLKLALWPLTIRSERSMRKQTEFQKKLQYIEQRYKNDPEALKQEKMELTKKYGFPAAGCLIPLLVQIPVLIGLNRVLSSSIELYKAPFVGWITDLSSKDPYYVLPLIAALGMVMQMSTAQATTDSRQQMSTILFAILIAAVTANLSAGLTLFIAVNTWFGIGQTAVQQWLKRRYGW